MRGYVVIIVCWIVSTCIINMQKARAFVAGSCILANTDNAMIIPITIYQYIRTKVK